MPTSNAPLFSFRTAAAKSPERGPELRVTRFQGRETLCGLYRYDIELLAQLPGPDIDTLLDERATLTLHRPRGDVLVHGVLVEFEEIRRIQDYLLCRAVLRPKAWLLSRTRHNQVFLGQDPEKFLGAALKDGGLDADEFAFWLKENYPAQDYVCQYQESHLDFFSRWAEHYGLAYSFAQGDAREQLLVTDSTVGKNPAPAGHELAFVPVSGLAPDPLSDYATGFGLRARLTPESVLVTDVNPFRPDLTIAHEAQISERGQGLIHLHGERAPDNEVCERLAKIRAEEYARRGLEYFGESTAAFLRPGYTFSLSRHPREKFNRSFLVTEVRSQGDQRDYLLAGLGLHLSDDEGAPVFAYRNEFVCIPDDIPFRPERITPKPRIRGGLSAIIDGAGAGQYAELDAKGRYKVIMPFDLSGRKDGKASYFIPKAESFAGESSGMHFPLHKGTEVLLTFLEGDLDRPVILGALSDPARPNQVRDVNQTMAQITTAGQNKIHIQDSDGQQRILLHSPATDSFLRLGSPNDPATSADEGDSWWSQLDAGSSGHALSTSQVFAVNVAAQNSIILGEQTDNVVGLNFWSVLGMCVELFLGYSRTFVLGGNVETNEPESITIGNKHQEIIPVETRMKNILTKIKGAKKTMRANKAKIAAAKKTLAASKESVEAITTEVKGTVESATALETKVANTVKKCTAEATETIGQVTEAIDSLNQEIADLNEIAGAVTLAAEEYKKSVLDETTVVGDVMKIVGEEILE